MSDLAWRCSWCGKYNDVELGKCECGTSRGNKSPVEGPPLGARVRGSMLPGLQGSPPPKREKPQINLEPEVRPLNVKIPQSAPREEGNTLTALVWSDTHFPFQDESVLAIVQAIAEDMQPDVLVHGGDLLDCYNLSRFDKDPSRKESLQDEIDQARAHLATMRLASPNSQFIALEGNHEQRLQRVLWNLDGPAATLGQLTAFRKAMTWPSLLGLDELGIEWVPMNEQSKQRFLPKFILKHGTVVRKQSGATAAAEQQKYNKSGSSGHTHRLGVVWHRDSNGSHVWIETGCTCGTDPDYTTDPDWQQGCLFLTFDKETGAVAPEPVFIHKGLGVFRGKTYGTRIEDEAA
jgi:predicted phosphodiesterase